MKRIITILIAVIIIPLLALPASAAKTDDVYLLKTIRCTKGYVQNGQYMISYADLFYDGKGRLIKANFSDDGQARSTVTYDDSDPQRFFVDFHFDDLYNGWPNKYGRRFYIPKNSNYIEYEEGENGKAEYGSLIIFPFLDYTYLFGSNTTKLSFDSKNRLKKAVNKDGQVCLSVTYTDDGRVSRIYDGWSTTAIKRKNGRLVSVTTTTPYGDADEKTFRYNSKGQIISTVEKHDAYVDENTVFHNKITEKYKYDKHGNLIYFYRKDPYAIAEGQSSGELEFHYTYEKTDKKIDKYIMRVNNYFWTDPTLLHFVS